MADFLTPVSTTTVKPSQPPPQSPQSPHPAQGSVLICLDSPEAALRALKDQPVLDTIREILQYLVSSIETTNGFSIATPGPISAQIINALVTVTVPDYWRIFERNGKDRSKLVKCLRNVSGLGAIMSRLRPLIADCRRKKSVDQTREPAHQLEDLLGVLSQILEGDSTSSSIWTDIQGRSLTPSQKTLMWKEYISLTAAGKVLSTAAQTEDVLKEGDIARDEVWCSNGFEYASWLGRNIGAMIVKDSSMDGLSAATQLCGKSLTLGYNGM